MASRKAPPFRISPSAIARYFYHDCERFLYYSSVTPEERKKLRLPRPLFDHSAVKEAVLQSGYHWEREVVETLLGNRVRVAPGAGELHGRSLPVAETLQALREERPGRYLYQPTLSPPPLFYQRYNLDRRRVVIHENNPDLIEILADGPKGRLLRIIDVKRGDMLQLTHRVQILFYALQLQTIIEAEGIADTTVDIDTGAVWLGQQAAPETFSLRELRPHLERFLSEDLMRILDGPPEEAAWHLYERCESCDFFNSCRQEMHDKDDVSRLVQLTPRGKQHLREEAGVQSLTELGRFLRRTDADEVLQRCASLAGQRHHMQKRLQALQQGLPSPYGAIAPDLPRGENVALFLTVQQEPLGKTLYLAGALVQMREELRQQILGSLDPEPSVWLAERPEQVAEVRAGLIRWLSQLLQRLHDYNAKQSEWRNQVTLQAYVHDEAERKFFFILLLEGLRDPALAEPAVTLLFHFQGPELLEAERHPDSESAYPIVVLNQAVQRLLALPLEVSYTLPEILEVLGSTFNYRRRDYFHFPLGHRLRAEALQAAWYGNKPENLEEIRKHARLYLFAVSALLRSIREHAGEYLVAWPPRFSLPLGTRMHHPLLSRLAYLTRYESVLQCLAIREERTEAREVQAALGQLITLRALTPTRMEVKGDLLVEVGDGFPSWLLVRDNAEGGRAQVEFNDYAYRAMVHGGPDSPHRAVVGVTDVQRQNGRIVLELDYARQFKDNPVAAGEAFLLMPRYTDFISDRLVEFLVGLDDRIAEGSEEHLFLRLLRQPAPEPEVLRLIPQVQRAAVKLEPGLGFTPSQKRAWQTIIQQRATVVWGPPGTGKTHFLASTILGLAAAYARAGRPFRVLVTAFTHSAIENLLRKIASRLVEMPELAISPALAKAKNWQSAEAGIQVVPEKKLVRWLGEQESFILGATAYSCLKVREELPAFDLVVIDEASQVRVPEAAVPISLVGEQGRLVLAGDHLQLPPIIAGIYPDTPADHPMLHRSIFETLSQPPAPDQMPTSPLMVQLLENFRLNDVLTSFAAGLLYGPGYRCGSPEVANQRLPFRPARGIDPMSKLCLDPDFPLVIVLLDGVRATRSNPVEADLAAQLVVALREGLRDRDGRLYKSDAAFFRTGVFVVSPHRAQIRVIQAELEKKRQWTSPPVVESVDRIQGQEAEAVIISYGVADEEFALREAEFIYGLNRLNVAITRARTKCVLCLPRPLLDASPAVLDVEAAAQGLGFMRSLVAAAEQRGEVETFEGDDVEACIIRVGRCW